MSASSAGRSSFAFRFFRGYRRIAPFLILPAALVVLTATLAFRPTPIQPLGSPVNPLVLPPGWAPPPVPADNPITNEKFILGRQLFYENELSADGKTSCGSCHNYELSFSSITGSHTGSNDIQGQPVRMVMRLENVGYDTVLTWDGHIQTLEQQATIAIQKKGDLFQSDTNAMFAKLASNPAYLQMFTNAFGDATITMDRIAKSIATFERCLISGNSHYDKYLNGDKNAMSPSAINGMKLFFDTNSTNCSGCHNNLGAQGQTSNNIFTDNNYYRTGTFEFSPFSPGGYGFDTTQDTLIREDAGRAFVTRDSADIGKFRTPSLRNVALHGPYGADGTVTSLSQVLENYNMGGNNTTDGGMTFSKISNQAPRIKKLNLQPSDLTDLEAFLNDLTDLDFINNPAFHNPGPAVMSVDDHVLGENLSLYPNPSVGNVNIECPDITGATEISIIDQTGKTVWQQSMMADGKLQLDLSNVGNGSYRVQLHTANVDRIVPFVLSR